MEVIEVVAVRTTPTGCTVPVEDELLDLVLSDPELLRAEFEAIIAASWPDPPNPPPPTRPAPPAEAPNPSEPGTRRSPLSRSGPGDPRPGCPRPAAAGRQRSPPGLTPPRKRPLRSTATGWPGNDLGGQRH